MADSKPKSPWLALAGSCLAFGAAGLTYLDNQQLRAGAKAELASNEIASIEIAERLSRVEAQMEARESHCACVGESRALTAEDVVEGTIPDEPDPPEPSEDEALYEALRPSPRSEAVQRKIDGYDW